MFISTSTTRLKLILMIGGLSLLNMLTACSSAGSASEGADDPDSGLVLLPVQNGENILNARTGAVLLKRPAFDDPEDAVGVHSTFLFSENGSLSVMDATGKKTAKPEGVPSFPFKDGMGSALHNGKCGYVNRDFKFVVPPDYDECYDFVDGRGPVRAHGVMGYVDKTGKVAIPLQYRVALNFSDGLGAVSNGQDQFGYVDVSGKLVIPQRFSVAGSFHDGIALVFDLDRREFVHIDKSGAVLPFIGGPFSEGRAFAKNGLIDTKGTLIPTPPLTQIQQAVSMTAPTRNVSVFQDGLAPVKAEGGVVLINRDGAFVTEPMHWIEPIAKGFWYAQKKDLTTEVLKSDGKPIKTPSPDCRPVEFQFQRGEQVDRFGVLVCPVTELTPEERAQPDTNKPLRKRGRRAYYYSAYGWRSSEFKY